MRAMNRLALSMNLSMSRAMYALVKHALSEDIGTGDVSVSLLEDKTISAKVITRQAAVICGIEYAHCAFSQLDGSIKINWQVADGDSVVKNQTLCSITGSSRAIISAERVALNFLQTLSGVATQTRLLVDKIAHTHTQLLDTRKTIPGLRLAQKYAVKCGGGANHRMGLFDCVMLKENHISAIGSLSKASELAREKYPDLPLIVEVENLRQLAQALDLSSIDRVLCDNFSIQDLSLAVQLAKGRTKLEASGNIDENNIILVAQTGVDYISIGAITKNIQAIDLSLRLTT